MVQVRDDGDLVRGVLKIEANRFYRNVGGYVGKTH